MNKHYSGVVVPMITPLHNDLSIDTRAVKILVEQFSVSGLHPLVLGTTGESPSIGEADSLLLLSEAIASKGAKQQIYAGLVGNQVQELIRRGKQYLALGADVLVVTLPSYYMLTSRQMKEFFLRIADELSGPVMIYNIKATTQMSIPLEVIAELSFHPNIAGLKDSERDDSRLRECIRIFSGRDDFSYFCGWGARSYESLKMGADGIVPSTGNIVPEMYGRMWAAAVSGDWEKCEYEQQQTDLVAVQYQQNRTLGESLRQLKCMLKEKGICSDQMMPPL